MLSLPLIVPRDHLYNSPNRSSPFQFDLQNNVGNQQQPGTNNNARRPVANGRSALAQLRADENLIEQRKHNVRRFGAGWLRPPGVPKTLQSKLEEEQERLEQLEMARRDAEQRAQEEAAQHIAAGTNMRGLDGEGVVDQEERDLDADVPEATDAGGVSDDEEDDEEEEEATADVTFNEESLLDGSFDTPLGRDMRDGLAELVEMDAELDGRLQDERDLGMVGDLDDDVPEAGSYEHTDTEEEEEEEEESSSEEEAVIEAPNQHRHSLRSDGRARRSLVSEDSEIIGSSSFMESSPAMGRRQGPGRGNAFRNSMMGPGGRRRS